MIYPKSLEELILYFQKLPGVGEKSAERYALAVVNFNQEDTEGFSKAVSKINKTLQKCTVCSSLSDKDICNICTSKRRKQNVICVVEDYKSVFMFEKIGNYEGVYHVLNGLISPIDGVNPDDINIASLVDRCKELKDVEVIVALKPTIEGEATTMYITRILDKKDIKVSRLSYGIPMGAEIDYLDALTLERALSDRQTLI